MALDGGMSCVKYLLFCFNLLFAVSGLIILIAGIKAEISAHPYAGMTDDKFFTFAPVTLIIAGIIIFIISFFGCCGAVKENHCMIITFSVLLLAIFVAEMCVGIAGYVKRDDLENSIARHLNETLKDYSTDKNVKITYDMIQTDFKCCGLNGPKDWTNNGLPIPATCCEALPTDASGATGQCIIESPTLHKEGCLTLVIQNMNNILYVLAGVGLGIAIVQLLGVIFACCLARSIRSQYETV